MIPTKELLLPVSKTKVQLREWLTQSQANKYLELAFGENLIEVEGGGGEGKLSMSMKDLNAANKFLIECALVEMTYEDYDNLHPTDRDTIKTEADRLKETNEKK